MKFRGTWMVESVEHATLDLGVRSSHPTVGAEVKTKLSLHTYCI